MLHHHHHPPLHPSHHGDNVGRISVIHQLNWIQIFILIPLIETKRSYTMMISAYKEIATDSCNLASGFLFCFVFFFLFFFSVNNKETYLLTEDIHHMAAHLAWFEAFASDTGP